MSFDCLPFLDATSQIIAVLSCEAVTTKVFWDENIAEITQSVWPVSVDMHSPVAMFHIFTVRSFDAVTTEASLDEKTAEFTQPL